MIGKGFSVYVMKMIALMAIMALFLATRAMNQAGAQSKANDLWAGLKGIPVIDVRLERPLHTYFVSPTGIDTAKGTEDSPWATIQKALDEAKAGDLVKIKCGVYSGSAEIKASGKPGMPIVVKAEPGTVLKPGSEESDGLRIINVSYIVVEGLDIQAPFDEGITVRNSHHIILRRIKSHGGSNGITMGSENHHILFQNLEVYQNRHGGVDVWKESKINDILFRNVNVHHNECYGGTDGIGISHGVPVRNIWFIGCIVHHNGMDGFDLSGAAVGKEPTYVLEGCISHHNAIGTGRKVWGAGVKLWVPNALIRNCIIYANKHEGGITCQGALEVYNSLFYANNEDHGIKSKGKVIVRNCIFYKERRALSLPNPASRIEHCLFFQAPIRKGSPGVGCIMDRDPMFADPANLDFHLKDGSPAIDNGMGDGAPMLDLDGRLRPQGRAVDIGPYEY